MSNRFSYWLLCQLFYWADATSISMVQYEVSQIASEAVWNALKHAQANEIRVDLTLQGTLAWLA